MAPDALPPQVRFRLTPRQRRLRWISAIILVVVAGMIVFGATSPLFHPIHPAVLTPLVRRQIKVRILFVGFYWIVCSLLASLLFLLAWLDIREVQRTLYAARKEVWQDAARQARERLGRRRGDGQG
ncbi:MAG: hypothetical protein ACP5VE_05805 [Chthonomonadales bacterium]